MRIKRWIVLSLAAVLTTAMLTGCPWDKEEDPGSSSSSSSSSSRPDDGGGDDGGDPDPIFYTVTASIGEGGTVTMDGTTIESGSYSVQEGTVLTFTVQPNEGYQIGTVTANGDELTGQDGTYTYTVNSNCTIAVSFKHIPKTFTMSVTADPSEGGSLAYTETATEGENWTLTITPNPGYMVSSVTDNGTEVTNVEDNTYTIENITADHTIVVTFTPTINPTDPSTWTVTEAGVIIVPAGADSAGITADLFVTHPDATGLDLTGSGVTTINGTAFVGCTSLQTVDMGSVTTIGAGAFQSCTSLTNVDMSSATTIGVGAFQNCTSLAHIRLGSVLPTTVYSGAFSGAGQAAGTITIYSDELTDDQKEDVKKWFDANITVNFRPSSEYPGAAAGNALAQYLTRLF